MDGNLTFVVPVEQSPMNHATNVKTQKSVKELARMFSTRSREQVNSIQPKKSASRPPEKTNHLSSGGSLSNQKKDPKYQNVLEFAKLPITVTDSFSLAKVKKPIPTPRKTSLIGVIARVDDSSSTEEDDDDDDYTPMSTSMQVLHSRNEIGIQQHPEGLADLPHPDPLLNFTKPHSQLTKNEITAHAFEKADDVTIFSSSEHKKVLDAANGSNRDKVIIGFSDNSDNEDSTEYYLPILPDQKRKNNPTIQSQADGGGNVIHRRITTEKNGHDWKRSQGSIFAEEMIGFYYLSPSSIEDKKNRASSHSYMEIDESRLRKYPTRVMSPTNSNDPVYVQAEQDTYILVQHSSSSDDDYTCSNLDKEVRCPISPPDLIPKSKSLLRELDEPVQEQQSPPEHPRKSKKSPNLIKALKTQQFVINKKKKKLLPVISSPRLPLYPPSMKTENFCESEVDSTSSRFNDQSGRHFISKSLSLSPLPIVEPTSLIDECLNTETDYIEIDRPLSSSPPSPCNMYRTSSDAVMHRNPSLRQRRLSSSNSNSGSGPDDNDVIAATANKQTYQLNTVGGSSRLRGIEDSNNYTNKRMVGYFTSQGGTLQSRESGVYVVVPVDAIQNGKRQKLWFEVLQSMCIEGKETLQESMSYVQSKEIEHINNQIKKDSAIQLSLTVSVGPPDAVLNKPIKVFIPHCASVDSSIWNLKIIGRSSVSDDWEQLVPSGSHFKPGIAKQKKYKGSTYKIYPDYFRVKTKHMGCFRMTGKPVVLNLSKLSKKMVSSVYCKTVNVDDIQVKVFVTNAFLDSIEVLHNVMMSEGYTCVERNIPTMCYGDHVDLNVSLLVETNEGKIATYLHKIPFDMFWRVTRIGKAVATFNLSGEELMNNKIMKIELFQTEDSHQIFEVLLPM